MDEAWKGLSAGAKTGVVVVVLVLLGLADWGFSFGPVTYQAVSRCTSSVEGDVSGMGPAKFESGHFVQTEDTYSRDEAKDLCWSRKRNGHLTLSGGIR